MRIEGGHHEGWIPRIHRPNDAEPGAGREAPRPDGARDHAPIPFAKRLEIENGSVERITPPPPPSDAASTDHRRVTAETMRPPADLGWPRLGDAPSIEKTDLTRRVEQAYQQIAPDPTRGLLDILV